MNPGPNAISGSGPAAGRPALLATRASGYQIWTRSVRGPSWTPVGPLCAGSVKRSQRWPVLNLPSTPMPAAGLRAADADGVADGDDEAAGLDGRWAAPDPAQPDARTTAAASVAAVAAPLIDMTAG